ncbi:hypothetical protein JRQ81_012301 [Phrynocephalus forsythii]|uniref:Uncharacterized protein n=1 Tax=Phrynocephalus forsythii TaxID=171643 RepID=A0A9Q1AQD0_9SAUR|nr:hypothetical protein JRQ81_012301 [Phrynocephalus forsythii]
MTAKLFMLETNNNNNIMDEYMCDSVKLHLSSIELPPDLCFNLWLPYQMASWRLCPHERQDDPPGDSPSLLSEAAAD